MSHATSEPPSEFLVSCSDLLPERGDALDLAAGRGRNARWLASRGLRVTAIDRDRDALEPLREAGIAIVVADLETPDATLPRDAFDVIVVCRYLWRPLFPAIRAALRTGGLLVYETFTLEQARFGKPTNPHFLLGQNELLRHFVDWHVLRYAEGIVDGRAAVAALAARKTGQLPG
ncbi:MAG: methyltransferase domain-containing protein [Planctomycetes bacterium]|nr:methyltransferase domain-containing protein [Planctomycetota bacterium]MBI3845569.1 methyltransferase domain-containing protein [Planctomycetota bacterium]